MTHYYLETKRYGLFRERFTQLPNAIQYACKCMCLALEKIEIYKVEGDFFVNPELNDFKHKRPNRKTKVAELNKDGNILEMKHDTVVSKRTIAPDFVLKKLLIEPPKEKKCLD